MRFLYKINSGYDGFRPSVIEDRLDDEGLLRLGWKLYIDEVNKGDECWLYFKGRHAFVNGIYARGRVMEVDRSDLCIFIKLDWYDLYDPLFQNDDRDQLAQSITNIHYRQVFVWPDEFAPSDRCDLSSCRHRHCEGCPNWKSAPFVSEDTCRNPHRLKQRIDAFVPAFWILPPRSYAITQGLTISRGTKWITHHFAEFKLGEKAYAFPLALGIWSQLASREITEFDGIVPIPLSPDKIGEYNRTMGIARELSNLAGIKVVDALALESPISRRQYKSLGYSHAQFEKDYFEALNVRSQVKRLNRILLIDDVCTEGSTLNTTIKSIYTENPSIRITVATAGQMIMRKSVKNPKDFSE